MKKLAFLLVLFGILSTQSFAGSGDLFNYDKEKVMTEMQQLNALEDMVLQNQDLTYDDLVAANNPLVAEMNFGSNMMMDGMSSLMPVVPAFWWGCVLGPIGILLVYVIEEDKDQTMSAFWGCVVGSAASAVIYTVYWFAVIAANVN